MSALVLAVFAVIAGLCPAARADQAQRIGREVSEALRDAEAERERAEQVLGAKLSGELQRALRSWIDVAAAEKTAQLNKPVDQRWELLRDMPPIRYEYTLNKFRYAVDRYDVLKTQSMLAPYKATAQLVETLFVTRYHPSHISDPKPFQYTAVTPVAVEFEYRDGRFVVTRAERGQSTLKQGSE